MKIELAGYNVDKSLLPENTTPETLTAAYARISRSPKTIETLRKSAIKNVDKARASNETIVYDYGHKSIAEHAVFNFDISGVSRLAIEDIERSRLASYTEKSQRYIKFKPNDEFFVPEEIKTQEVIDFINHTHQNYHRLLELIDKPREDNSKPEEDARYISTLSVCGQLGLTINASSLECMIRRLKQSPLTETQQIAEQLYQETIKIAPSLIKHVDVKPNKPLYLKKKPQVFNECKLLSCSATDETVGGMLAFENQVAPYQNQDFSFDFQNLNQWDTPPRAFEMAELIFEVTLSASCFAQMKRHRTFSIITQQYDPSLFYTVPPAIKNNKEAFNLFTSIMAQSAQLYYKIQHQNAQYILTQAHRRRAIIKTNPRALYNFSRLRQDIHAQWDIRNLANKMISLAKQQLPNTMKLACGKSEFENERNNL